MKTPLFILLIFLAVVSAQGQTKWTDRKSALIISAGVSVPVVCYASKNMGNENAGFAKIGFNINLIYEFNIFKNAGVAGRVFYSFNGFDKKIAQESPGAALSNYKYYGLMIGPFFKHTVAGNTDLSIKFLPGIIRVNSPSLAHQGSLVTTKGGATDFVWSAGADMKYHLPGRNSFILLNSDFTSSKPQFKVPALGENVKVEQHIAVININGGFGIKF